MNPEAQIIFRAFNTTEVILRTLSGWKKFREVILLYHLIKKGEKDRVEIELEPNVKGCIKKWGNNGKQALIIELADLRNVKSIFLFPIAIKKLTETIYDQIDSSIRSMFHNVEEVREIHIDFTDLIRKNRNKEHAIYKFKKLNIDNPITDSLIKNFNIIKRNLKMSEKKSFENLEDLDDISLETFPGSPKKRDFEDSTDNPVYEFLKFPILNKKEK